MWSRMTLAIVTLVTAGCLVLPYREGRDSSETFIEEESLKFIEIGQSTRAELQQAIGSPDWNFNGGSRWIYKTRRDVDWRWGVCVGDVISGQGSCSRSRMVETMTILDLNFDSFGVVSRKKISSLKPGSCTESQVCFSPLTAYATADDDAYAKQFLAEPGRCAIYLFTVKSFSPVSVRIDATDVIQRYKTDTGYLRLSLDAGVHNLDDEDWVVKVHTMAGMLSLPLDYELMNAVAENLNDTHWPTRLMAVYLLAKNQGGGFAKVLNWTAKYDSEKLVRDMAITLGAAEPQDQPPQNNLLSDKSRNSSPTR